MCLLPALSSCTGKTFAEDSVETVKDIRVQIHYEGQKDVTAKSSFNWNDDAINDIQLFIFDKDGNLHDQVFSDNTDNLHFRGIVGNTYHILAAANLGERLETEDIGTLLSIERPVSFSDIASKGIPMFSRQGVEIVIDNDSTVLDLTLTRMLARIDVSLDKTLLGKKDGFSVKSVIIRNAVNAFHPFEENVKQEQDAAGYGFDCASNADVELLNNGGVISLYAFENMQGTLLPGNTDPWDKVPENIPANAGFCSYLELSCTYAGENESSEDIAYRMYLGKDATTNFDVVRNTVYRIIFCPTEKEIYGNRGSWKIESSGWVDNRPETIQVKQYRLLVLPGQLSISNGETSQLSAYLEYRTGSRLVTEDDSAVSDWSSWSHRQDVTYAAGTFWYSDSPSVADVTDGEVTGGSDCGSAYISATHEVEGKSVSDYCCVTVKAEVVGLELDMSPARIEVGEVSAASVTAHYSDGSSRTINNEDCSWEVDRGGTISSGVFHATAPGWATITVKYSGKSAEFNLFIEEQKEIIERRLVVTPGMSSIDEGESVSLHATLYTSTNGTEDSGIDVTGQSSWGIQSGSGFVEMSSPGTFVWKDGPGESIVSATYTIDGNQVSGMAAIATSEPISLVSLTAEPQAIMLEYDNLWSEEMHFTAVYSNGQSADVSSETTVSDLSFALISNSYVTAISEGNGTLTGTYTFRGISKSASIQVTSVEEWMTEGIHCSVQKEGSSFHVYDIMASKISPFRPDSRNVPLTRSEYSFETSGVIDTAPDGFIIHGNADLTVTYTCPVTGDELSFTVSVKNGVCTNTSD